MLRLKNGLKYDQVTGNLRRGKRWTMIEGSLEVKLPTIIWTDKKAEQGRGREKRKIRRKKSRRERVRRKKMEMCEKVGKSRNTVFFQWFGAPEGRKVGSLKRRVRSQLARWEMKKLHAVCGAKHICKSKCTKQLSSGPLLEVAMSKKCTPLWREAHFQVKMYKAPQLRTTFGSCDVEKSARRCGAKHIFQVKMYKTPQLRTTFGSCDVEKSARRCGAKHISKSKCTKHLSFGPLLEVAMSKKVHAVVARSTFRSENVQNTTCSRHFWRFRCRKSARRCGAKHILKWTCTKH